MPLATARDKEGDPDDERTRQGQSGKDPLLLPPAAYRAYQVDLVHIGWILEDGEVLLIV